MSDTWAPADVNMQDYWAEVIGGEYKPVKHGKHASTHPRTVKAVLDGVRGSEIADVIVGMIFWQTIARNREQMAWERVRELEAEIASLRRDRAAGGEVMNITPDMAWLRSRDGDGKLPPPPADVDVGKLRRNGWCREVDGGWVVTESAAWALGIGEERVRQEIEGEH